MTNLEKKPEKKQFEDPALLELGGEPLGPEDQEMLRRFMEGDPTNDDQIRKRMKVVFENTKPAGGSEDEAV